MAKKWSELRKKMSPRARARAKEIADGMIREIETLNQLRSALDLTQEQIADLIKSSQANISKIETRNDMYVSTLQRYIEALGGKLKLVAEVNGKEYRLRQFEVN